MIKKTSYHCFLNNLLFLFGIQNLTLVFDMFHIFLLQMYISLVSLSIDGSLMCTVDVKLPEEELGGLVTLKFWNHGSSAGNYFLSTVIYEPHRLVHVYKVADKYKMNV